MCKEYHHGMRLADIPIDQKTEDVLSMIARHEPNAHLLGIKAQIHEDLNEWERIGRITAQQHQYYIDVLDGIISPINDDKYD